MLVNKSLTFLKKSIHSYKSQLPTNSFMTLNQPNLYKSQLNLTNQMLNRPILSPMMQQTMFMSRQFSSQVVAEQQSVTPQLKIKRNTATDELQLLDRKLPKTAAPQCFFPQTIVKKINRTQIAQKKNIKYSAIKLNAACMVVRKRHLQDALQQIQVCNKKGGPLVKSVLEAARANAVKKGLQEERLFVKECIVGKALGQKKMDIRARGKFGMIHAPKSSIRIVLEEKQPEDFFKLLVKGQCPASIGEMFRKMLYVNQASFEQVRKFSFMTTAKGRYYRKVQFQRLCQLIQKDYAKQGSPMSYQKIERNLLEKASRDYVEDYQNSMEKSMLTSHTERQAHFEQNYKKK